LNFVVFKNHRIANPKASYYYTGVSPNRGTRRFSLRQMFDKEKENAVIASGE